MIQLFALTRDRNQPHIQKKKIKEKCIFQACAQRKYAGRVYDRAKINGQYPINSFEMGCLYLKLLSPTDSFSFPLC